MFAKILLQFSGRMAAMDGLAQTLQAFVTGRRHKRMILDAICWLLPGRRLGGCRDAGGAFGSVRLTDSCCKSLHVAGPCEVLETTTGVQSRSRPAFQVGSNIVAAFDTVLRSLASEQTVQKHKPATQA